MSTCSGEGARTGPDVGPNGVLREASRVPLAHWDRSLRADWAAGQDTARAAHRGSAAAPGAGPRGSACAGRPGGRGGAEEGGRARDAAARQTWTARGRRAGRAAGRAAAPARICAPRSSAAPAGAPAARTAMVGRLNLQDVPELVDTKKKGDGVLDSPDSGLPPSPSPSHWGLAAAGGGGGSGERAPASGTLESDVAATPAVLVSGSLLALSLPILTTAGPRETTSRPCGPFRGALSAPPPSRRDGVAIAGSPGRERCEFLASWSRWLENCHRLGGAGAPGRGEPPPPPFGVAASGAARLRPGHIPVPALLEGAWGHQREPQPSPDCRPGTASQAFPLQTVAPRDLTPSR